MSTMAAPLNREEAQIDQAITQLQDTVRADIAAFAQSSPSDEAGRKLQSQIQRNTTHFRARLRELELLAEEQETIEEGDAVVAVVTKHKRSYEELQRALRNAHLEVQRRTAQAAQEQRRALMGSGDFIQRAQQLKTQQDLTSSAADTTASLQRTRQLMAEELQHTSATLAAMETSETTLKAANTQYRDQRGTIKQSHTLLRTMRVNSLKDSLKLYAALAFFTLVMAYIGFRRMSYFVPPAIINSLPSLKTFGIGQTQANSSAGMAYLDQQQYEVPGTDGGGNEGHSTAGKSSSQTRLAEVQRHAGNLLRQGAHYSRRLAVWLVQQSQRLIAGIKQKIEERQGRKLGQGDPPGGSGKEGGGEAWPDPSDPAYEVPPAVYEEHGQPRQQQAGQDEPTGAHPGYAGGAEAMYGGGSMRGNVASSEPNITLSDSSGGGDSASNQTAAPEAASNGQRQWPDQNMGANEVAGQSTQVPDMLDRGTAHEQTEIGVAEGSVTDMSSKSKNAGIADIPGLKDTELTTGKSSDPELISDSIPSVGGNPSIDSDTQPAAEDIASTVLQDMSKEPVVPDERPARESIDAEGEDAPATGSAGGEGETTPLEQDVAMQQGGDIDVTESALSDTPEDEAVYLPRQGTMPEPPEEIEDSTVTAAAETAPQEDQQDQAEKGVGEMLQPDPPTGEEDSDASREAAAPTRRDRAPLSGKVLGRMRWPEEGPSRPRGSTEEVQRTGGVGSSERGATGSGRAGALTGQASGRDRVTETTDSSAMPEKEREEEIPVSEAEEGTDEETRDRMTEATDSPALPEEEEEPVSEAMDSGEGTASGNVDLMGDDSGTEAQEGLPPGHREADESAPVEHMKDEL